MGQGALWYSAQFYAQTFLESTLLINYQTVYGIVCIAVIFAAPFFVVFGHLSDVYGRKVFIVGGLVFGAALLYPLFMGMAAFAPYQVINEKVVKNAVNGNASNVMICFLVWVSIVLVTMVIYLYLSCTVLYRLESHNSLFLRFLDLSQLSLWNCFLLASVIPPCPFLIMLETVLLVRIMCLNTPFTLFIYVISLYLSVGGLVPVLGLTATSVWTKRIFAGLYFPLACISLCALICFFFVAETKGLVKTKLPQTPIQRKLPR